MAFKILRLCPASLYTEMAKSALFSFFLGAIFDCNAEFPQWHGLEENHVSCDALDVSHTLSSSFFSLKNKKLL